MKCNRNLLIASLITILVSTPVARTAHAQEDLPPPPDFDNSFPPPPPPGGGGGGFGGAPPANFGGGAQGSGPTPAAPNANDDAAGAGGGLSKKQKDKFNKSGIEDVTNQNFPETIESFDFPNVEITDVIKTISELTGKNFIVDPGVRGKITIIAPSKITVAEAYKAFLSALAINGYTVVPSGSFMKVKNARNAQRDSIETYSGAYYPNDDQMITRIIHLKHISAETVNRELRGLTSKDGELNPYTPTNSLIMSDYGSNVDRVMKILNQLDVPGFEDQIEVVRVVHGKAKDLADLIDKIVNKGQKSTAGAGGVPGSFSSGIPRFTRSTGQGASGQAGNSFFMAIPDDRTNSIVVVGNKSGITRVKKLVQQLDFPVRPDAIGGVYVYYVKYGDAEKIAQVMQGVTKDAAPKQGANANPGGFPPFGGFGAPAASGGSDNQLFGGEVKVTADKNTNSIVVLASKQDYERVLNLLSKIDIPRNQVFVEANIMEMQIQDGNTWNVGYYKYADGGIGKSGFNTFSDLTTLLSPVAGSGGILGFGQGKTIDVTDPTSGKSLKIPNLLGFINFLRTSQRGNTLSNPTLTVLDNDEGTIEVGSRVATSVNTTQGTSGVATTTANFEDATLKLKLKPFISPASGTIRLEINQSIKQPTQPEGAPDAIKNATVSLATRSIETKVVVRDGDTAVLGGLIRDAETEKITKVPLLGDLPIIGWLFKGREATRNKTNLVVFLTPKIIKSQDDMNPVVSKQLDRRLEFIKGSGGKDPFGKAADEIMRRTASAIPSQPAAAAEEPFAAPAPQQPQAPADSQAPLDPKQEQIRQENQKPPTGLDVNADTSPIDDELNRALNTGTGDTAPAPAAPARQNGAPASAAPSNDVDQPLTE